jgi:hypothetical protein
MLLRVRQRSSELPPITQVTLVPNRTTHQADVKLKRKTALDSSPRGALGLVMTETLVIGLAMLLARAMVSTVVIKALSWALEGGLKGSIRQVFGAPAVGKSFLERLLRVQLLQLLQQNTVLGA